MLPVPQTKQNSAFVEFTKKRSRRNTFFGTCTSRLRTLQTTERRRHRTGVLILKGATKKDHRFWWMVEVFDVLVFPDNFDNHQETNDQKRHSCRNS